MRVVMLGSAGTVPVINRPLTSLHIAVGNKAVLIDCGEGTQLGFAVTKVGFGNLSVICITHCHPDHTLGLPGLISTMNTYLASNAGGERVKKNLLIICPKDGAKVIQGLIDTVQHRCIGITIFEVSRTQERIIEFDGFRIECFPVEHTVNCLGYSIVESHRAKMDFEKAEANKIDTHWWGFLQKGYVLEDENGNTQDVFSITSGEGKEIKVSYVTDTFPFEGLIDKIRGADLAVLEGIDFQRDERTESVAHMFFDEAAMIAKEAGVKELWLTHFGPALMRPNSGLTDTRKIFPETFCGKIGMRKDFT